MIKLEHRSRTLFETHYRIIDEADDWTTNNNNADNGGILGV